MKRLLLVLVVLLFMGADKPKGTQPPPATVAPKGTKVASSQTVASLTLSWDYGTNEIRADDLYENKTLEVSGQPLRVMKADEANPPFGPYMLKLGLCLPELPVMCYFDKTARKQLAELDIHLPTLVDNPQQVTIIGTCRGVWHSSVVLSQCKIVVNKPRSVPTNHPGDDTGWPKCQIFQ